MHRLGDLIDKCTVEKAVVIDFVGMIVVNHANAAQLFCLVKKGIQLLRIIRDQPHFEQLIFGAVFLRADIGDIEAVRRDQLQNSRYAAGFVLQTKLQQHNVTVFLTALEIADRGELFGRFRKLLRGSLCVDKQHMGIHCFVIADSGDIDAERRKAFAGFQESADVIRHFRDKGLVHF